MYSGGEVINSGGYGCIFYPKLNCKNTKLDINNININYISKLLIKKDAYNEYNKIKLIHNILKNIYNYKEYYLIENITMCKPEDLTNNDKINIEKCINLTENYIDAENINSNLNKLRIINMPKIGNDLDFLFKNNLNTNSIYNLSNKLINLLKNGIIPMNNKEIYHNDIKSGNLLYTNTNLYIIDWGESIIKSTDIPSFIRNRPLQYNTPFSNILFNSTFNKFYKKELELLDKNNISLFNVKIILTKYFITTFIHYGHYEYIINIILNDILVFLKPSIINEDQYQVIKYSYGLKIIVNYIADIVYNFTDFNTLLFKEEEYFNKVYKHNIDLWGFLTIYYDILNNLINNKSINKKIKDNLSQLIINIIIKYLYSTNFSSKKINHNELIKDLNNVNKFLKDKKLINNDLINGGKSKKLVKEIYNTRNQTCKSRIIKNNKFKSSSCCPHMKPRQQW